MSAIYTYEEWPARQPQAISETEAERPFPATNVMAITGPGTAFGDGTAEPEKLEDIPKNTIIVVESRSTGIPWPEPGDFDIRDMPTAVGSPDGRGISVVAAGFT